MVPIAVSPMTHWTVIRIQRRSAPCSAAESATRPAAPKPPASAQMPTCTNGEPVNAAINAPKRAPATNAKAMAARSRLARMRRRSVGPSMSQKPSADDASTGPNMRESTIVKARMPATAAQGSRPRAARQPAVSQTATTCWAWMIEDTSMAPIMTSANTNT